MKLDKDMENNKQETDMGRLVKLKLLRKEVNDDLMAHMQKIWTLELWKVDLEVNEKTEEVDLKAELQEVNDFIEELTVCPKKKKSKISAKFSNLENEKLSLTLLLRKLKN